MKRMLCLMLSVLFIAALSACSPKSRPVHEATPTDSPSEEVPSCDTDAPYQQADPTKAPQPTAEPTKTPQPTAELENGQNVDFRFVTKSFTWEEADGYTFEATVKVSPWIAISNEATLNAAWSEVGNGNALPTNDDWDLIGSWPDMYYCVGQIKIRNKTTGWDITATRSRSTRLCMSLRSEELPASVQGMAFYSSSTKLTTSRLEINPKMTTNYWGPLPFVMMIPEHYGPNYPQGQNFDIARNGSLEIYTWWSNEETFKIGVIDNDRYYAPEN